MIKRFWFDITTPGFGWHDGLRTLRENILIKLSGMLPRALVYWAFVRFVNAATNCSSPDISCIEAMKRNGDWYAR
jgi:hypothetical protein